MGETKDLQLHRGVKLTRIITATLAGMFFFILLAQIAFFPNIKISFRTGSDAQPLEAITIKKGTAVELPTPLKPGSCFVGWSLSPDSNEIIEDSTGFKKNTTLYAVWDGAEKYAVLSVNGIKYGEVNIFDTSVEGLTATQLNNEWRVLDDFATDNQNRAIYRVSNINSSKDILADPNNNFTRFLGWQYLNAYGVYNDLLYEADATGTAGKWTLIQRDAEGNETSSEITETNKFYPPNYRTTFTAILDYRMMNIQFFDKDAKEHDIFTSKQVKLGEKLTFPVYKSDDPSAHFSHWELQLGALKDYIDESKQPELAKLVGSIKTRYEAGEVIDAIDPLWYFLGKNLKSLDGISNDLVVNLIVRAVYWDNSSVYHYSIQPYTDSVSGIQNVDFSDTKSADLSLEKPVAFEGDSIWFFYDPEILSYTFYDHHGEFHEILSASLKNNPNTGLSIGDEALFLEQKIYFNHDWAITICVNYRSSAENISVKFNYGEGVYKLPNYRYYDKPIITTYTRKIGNSFVLLTGENYLKTDHIFTGWRLAGDESGHVYCAGEWFTIPNFNIDKDGTVLEFEAVWHLQRLLFDFDFNGGQWTDDDLPDFTSMKGAYGNQVQIVKNVPERFGYDFVGWTLEQENYTDASELLQPGDKIEVGTKIQVLHAQWKPRELRVIFYVRNMKGESVLSGILSTDVDGNRLSTGAYIKLVPGPYLTESIFNGWKIGENITLLGGSELELTTAILSQLETTTVQSDYDDNSYILEVAIYADQTPRTIDVIYDLAVEVGDSEPVLIKVDNSKLNTVLIQGDFFYNYYPFSATKSDFDTCGRSFSSWSYSKDNGATYEPINETTVIPVGQNKIKIRGELDLVKSITVVYHNFYAETIHKLDDRNEYYTYPANITLANCNDFNTAELEQLPDRDDKLGTFVGWSLEPDNASGNPEIIFDLYYNQSPRLQLSNQTDTTISEQSYLIDIDRYAKQIEDNFYVLNLYAVYANDYANVTYNYLKSNDGDNTELRFPVFSNGNYDKTVFGGSTVAPESPAFLNYGYAILDDSTLPAYAGSNFVGWEAILPDGVNPSIKDYFENKIWFPGEFMPAIDFDIEFRPIRRPYSDQIIEIKVGNRPEPYKVLSLGSVSNFNFNGSVDIVALPSGNYTIVEGAIKINSDREVHIVVPTNNQSKIIIEPRAIQCNTIKEFYVGENLTVTGSPVIGEAFAAYRVQKGYRIMDADGRPTETLNASNKYDYQSSINGLLVSADRTTLYGVPSHTNLSSDELFNYLATIGIQQIKSYAFADLNSLPTINLGFALMDDAGALEIEPHAIFNGNVSHVILPSCDNSTDTPSISPEVLSGALVNLKKVTFGNETNKQTNYAFVEGGIVYYVDNIMLKQEKTHVMYVMFPMLKLENLDYTKDNLCFANTVAKIEPNALMGCDWTRIKSVMAENQHINVNGILGIPKNVPFFIHAENDHKAEYVNRMIQPYEKKFIFSYYDSITGDKEVTLTYKYGQTFTVPNAQNNAYFHFDKLWARFIGWKLNGSSVPLFEVGGPSYKVGISDAINVDNYTLYFSADNILSWESFPVQFYTFNGKNNEAYTPEFFEDAQGEKFKIDELGYLNNVYLPGVQQTFEKDGAIYQFIGWGTKQTNPKIFATLLWNNTDIEYRILPNKTANADLDAGLESFEGLTQVYKYYALYEKITPEIEYSPLEDKKSLTVANLTKFNVTSLNIPFASYRDGYMLPITKINSQVFNNITNRLTEISIGGAVSEICEEAFNNVSATNIYFAHKGRTIKYNDNQIEEPKQLRIGRYAFARNDAIQQITLPAALTTLSEGAFESCSLVKVSFEKNPALNSIGNFVFRYNNLMDDNEVVRLLINDGKNGKPLIFEKVGDGIFWNTKINNVSDANGKPTNKIVWNNKLLHVFYTNGISADQTFNEKYIAGYAFVNASGITTIRISNPEYIYANAFSGLNPSIENIHLTNVNIDHEVGKIEIDDNAFDASVTTKVNVYTSDEFAWSTKFGAINKNFVFN